jgi:hypothetical protein
VFAWGEGEPERERDDEADAAEHDEHVEDLEHCSVLPRG